MNFIGCSNLDELIPSGSRFAMWWPRIYFECITECKLFRLFVFVWFVCLFRINWIHRYYRSQFDFEYCYGKEKEKREKRIPKIVWVIFCFSICLFWLFGMRYLFMNRDRSICWLLSYSCSKMVLIPMHIKSLIFNEIEKCIQTHSIALVSWNSLIMATIPFFNTPIQRYGDNKWLQT